MRLRVLTWNLFHGRSIPPAGRDLLGEFTAALAGWEWDVALLQEVPPWWPRALAASLGAEQEMVLTSRNALLPLRRALAVRAPDLMRSGGGGANAILARDDRIVAARSVRLCRRPERRMAHGVQLAAGVWVVNLHATVHDARAARRDVATAAAAAREWSAGDPLVFGGDLNLRAGEFPTGDLTAVADSDVDHLLVGGGLRSMGAESLERGALSDHAPLAVTLDVAIG